MYRISDHDFLIARLTLLLLVIAASIPAQVDKASVVGRITDPSGGVVPGGQVEMRRLSTNELFRAQSTSSGDYTIVNLTADVYSITVGKAGFAPARLTDVQLEVGQTRRVDIRLQVNGVAQQMEVQSQPVLLNTDSASTGTVIDNSKINGIPLNSRDVVGGLALLSAGAAPLRGTNDTRGSNYTVRGQRYTDNFATVDGASVSFGNGGLLMSINPDAVQEFSVKTGLYGAEYGIKPGAQFSLILKSGTNSPHGSLYEYLRNSDLDARNFFAPSKQPYHRHQFGGVFGAPVIIPKLFNGKDRMWFFFAFSAERVSQFQPLTGVVPTTDQRAGVFPSKIIDPLNGGQPFPNFTIPASRIDPVAQKLLSLWPAANTTGTGFNFTSPNSVLRQNSHQIDLKMDYRASDTDHWSGTMMRNVNPNVSVNAIADFGRTDYQGSWEGIINNSKTFGTRLVNNFTVDFLRLVQGRGATTTFPDFSQSLGIPGFPLKAADFQGVPTFSVTGFLPLGEQIQHGQVSYGEWSARDDVSFVSGAHSFKAGYQWRRNYIWPMLDNRSSFSATSRYSGNAMADFLLGYLSSATQSAPSQRGRVGENNQYVYFQDDWKARSRLTVNLGVRYEYFGPWKDRRGFLANFNPGTGQLFPALQNLSLQPGEEGRYLTDYPLVQYLNKGLQPRVGLAYRITSKTVLRGGFGIYGNDLSIGMPQNMGSNPRPNSAALTFNGSATAPNVFLSNPFNVNALSPVLAPNLNALQPVMPQMNVYTWGTSIQQQFDPNTVLTVGYQGSHTAHDYVLTQLNDAIPGPGALQTRRPYTQWGSISSIQADGDNRYNGLTVELEHRPGASGLSMKLAYTWAKTLDTVGGRFTVQGDPGGVSNNLSLRANRGRSEGDVPSLFVLMTGYELPFGTGKQFLTSGFLGKLVGGWSFYDVLTLNSGPYITPVMSFDALNVGSSTSQRPDALHDPNLPSSQRTIQRWFDTAAFATPRPLQYGNAGRSIIKGPGLINLDLSVMRNFRIKEAATMQFRFSAFNATNHANLGLPGTSFGTATFGVIGSALDPRDLEFGLKFFF